MSIDPSTSIPDGATCVEDYDVTADYVAKHIEEVQVLSTPALVLFMERTSMRCVQRYLPEMYTTVGTLVNVKHLNPAPLGSRIRVESKLLVKEGRRLVFEVRAYLGSTLIGEGLHERFIVNREKFAEKIKRVLSQLS